MRAPQGYDRRPRWRECMLRSTLNPTTKLVLLVTLEHMRANGKVCIGRETVARALGIKHPQRISERWAQACEAGFLTLVHKGSHGRHSTYEALIPEPSSVRVTRTLGEPENPDTRESPLVSGKRGRYTYSPGTDSAPSGTRVPTPVANERRIYGEPGEFPDRAEIERRSSNAGREERSA